MSVKLFRKGRALIPDERKYRFEPPPELMTRWVAVLNGIERALSDAYDDPVFDGNRIDDFNDTIRYYVDEIKYLRTESQGYFRDMED